MLTLSRKVGQAIVITIGGQRVRVIVGPMRKGNTRLHIEAPREVRILRAELEGAKP